VAAIFVKALAKQMIHKKLLEGTQNNVFCYMFGSACMKHHMLKMQACL
jgi:hypothetical protein